MKRVYLYGLSLLSACSTPGPLPPAAGPAATVNSVAQSASASQQITPAAAAQVCLGQTLPQVEALLGRRGQIVNPPAIAGGPATYQWQNPDGSYLWVAFANGQVIGMGAVGLSSDQPLALNSACASN